VAVEIIKQIFNPRIKINRRIKRKQTTKNILTSINTGQT